jgi:O-antigen/teichoic acid export membrane protein
MAEGLAVDAGLALLLRGASLAVTVAVARKLAPAEYGAVSIALAIFGIGDLITNPAIRMALIRRQERDEAVFSVAWTIMVVRGVLLAALLFALARPLAHLWDGDEVVVTCLRVLALSPLVTALSNIFAVQLQQDLRFGLSFLVDNSAVLFGTLSSLGLLLWLESPVALAVGPVCGNAVSSIATWLMFKSRPTFRWIPGVAADLLRFSRWLMGHAILIYLCATVDNLYVGKELGLAALGAYALAWKVVNTGMTILTRALPKMLAPAYAQLRDRPDELRRRLLIALGLASALGSLASAIMVLFTEEIFLVLGGRNIWPETVPIARALVLYVFVRMIEQVFGPLFQAVGEARTLMFNAGIRLVLMVPGLYLGARWGGVVGVAVAVSLIAVVVLALFVNEVGQRFSVNRALLLRSIVLPIIAVVVSAVAARYPALWIENPVIRLLFGSGLVAGCFLVVWEALRVLLPSAQMLPLASRCRTIVTALLARIGVLR